MLPVSATPFQGATPYRVWCNAALHNSWLVEHVGRGHLERVKDAKKSAYFCPETFSMIMPRRK